GQRVWRIGRRFPLRRCDMWQHVSEPATEPLERGGRRVSISHVRDAPAAALTLRRRAVGRRVTMSRPRRLIIGISGASGTVYGIRLLEVLKPLPVETHLVMTRAAKLTLAHETDVTEENLQALANAWYPINAVDAPLASGSFETSGMIIAPYSIRCLSAIATGVTSDLLTRAADVVLKERRRLVLMVRETPLHTGHLRTMTLVSELGAIVAPPVPAFYTRPSTLDDVIDHSIGRILDLFGIETGRVKRWGEKSGVKRPRHG